MDPISNQTGGIMFCPKCKTEYTEGVFMCAECRTELVPELPPGPEESVEYVNLVTLETYSGRPEAELAKGVLSVNGIDAVVSGDEYGGYESVLAFLTGVRLLVKKEDLEKAKKILSEIESSD
jgi:hypothetical protein